MNLSHSTSSSEDYLSSQSSRADVRIAPSRLSPAILLTIGFVSLCFLAGGVRLAASTPLWMDEVLAVWVVRLHTARDVLSALTHGSEFAPPTYDLIVHWFAGLAGTSYRALRLPSLLAGLFSGLCVFALLRRYLSAPSAAFGLAFTLLGVLSGYAMQVRPYILVVACFSLCMLLWDDLDRSRRLDLPRLAAIAVLLAGAVALHFYAVLLVVCVAGMELSWSVLNQRLRFGVWVSLFLAGASSFFWLPLIRTLSRYNAGDTSSLAYYARPSLGKLIAGYVTLFLPDKRLALLFILVVVLFGLFYAFRQSVSANANEDGFDDGSEAMRSRANLFIIAFSTIAFPIVVFLFAKFVTKTFNVRYCLIAGLGFSILAGCLVNELRGGKLAISLSVLASSVLMFLHPASQLGDKVPDILTLFARANTNDPIVVGEGLQYFQIEEAVPADLKDRIYFVTSPADARNDDPTNENQVKRWKSIRPDLRVVDAKSFFLEHPHFYLLHTAETADLLTDWLLRHSLLKSPVAFTDDAWLFQADAPKAE